ncbi:MAG TPA: DNA translocase FtsK 4TM domain-containing protein, partial [Myxococcota bacterium]|nr:DNA translocase FtsK 4TM domain-containing protein [Myxococcota bacterium]
MARRARKKDAAAADERIPGRLEAEIAALVLLAFAAFAELALLSYVPADPLWAWHSSVANRAGPVGALIAGLLAGQFGWAAHALPFAGAIAALRYLRGMPVRPRWIPLVAWTSCWLSLAALLAAGAKISGLWSASAGGRLGAGLVGALSSALHLAGATLLLCSVLVLSLLVATGTSLRDVLAWLRPPLRSLGRGGRQLVRVSLARALRRREQWLERREARREEQGESVVPEDAPAERRAPEAPRKRARPAVEPEVVEHRVPLLRPQRQEVLPFADAAGRGPYRLPDLDLLAQGQAGGSAFDREALIKNSEILQKKLADFSVHGRVVKVHPGPVITMYEFEPAPGVKVSRIVNLSDDLALALRALAVRIVAPIPGKSVVGVEVPNQSRDVVVLRDILSHPTYQEAESRLQIA